MIVRSIVNLGVTCAKALNDESKLCFGAAAGCFVIGTISLLVNLVVAEATRLHGLLVIAVFYSALGVISLFKRSTTEAEHLTEVSAVAEFGETIQGDSDRDEPLQSAA